MSVEILIGDAITRLRELPSASVHCCVTSPPYWGLRDYGADGQIGLEETPEAWVARLVEVFREVKRVLRKDGVCFVNIGDSYAQSGSGAGHGNADQAIGLIKSGTPSNCGHFRAEKYGGQRNPRTIGNGLKPKDLIGQPWLLAFALRADGWWLRSEIIWAKPNPMPESVRDRPTKAHEQVFLLTKSERYFYDAEAIRETAEFGRGDWTSGRRIWDHLDGTEGRSSGTNGHSGNGGRNARSVWTIATEPFSDWAESVRQIPVAADAAVDGKKRRASPDCPLHGDHPAPAATARDGGHAADLLSRSPGNGADPAPEQPVGSVPTEQRRVHSTAPASSDSPGQPCSPSATDRSSRSRRTARDPATSPACRPCAQTPARTGDTSGEREPCGSAGHMPESSTALDGSAASRTHRTADCSAHTQGASVSCEPSNLSECTCTWYIEETSKTSHFATFPTELARRCILAGTSAKGCCPECGAPWARVVEVDHTPSPKSGARIKNYRGDTYFGDFIRTDKHVTTTGWRPTCECCDPEIFDAEQPVPCTVLDPFGGSGTTGLVADQLGRNAVLIELNPAYADMARRRIDGARARRMIGDVTERATPLPGQAELGL